MVVAPMASAADMALVNLLPPNARIFFGANLAQTRNTPFAEYALSQLAVHDMNMPELTAATGFDPRRDLLEVAGASRTAGEARSGLIVFRGAFDLNRILDAAKARGNNPIAYRGVKIVSGADDSGALAFLDPSLLVAGSAEQVTAGIDRWRTGAAATEKMAAKLAEVSSTNDVWFVTLGSPAALADRTENSMLSGAMKGEIVQAIQEMRGGIKFGPEVKISGESITRTADDAVALASVVRFFVTLADVNIGSRTGAVIQGLGSRMQLVTEANRVRFSVSMPEPEFEKLLETLRKSGRRAAASEKDNAVAASSSLTN